MLANSRMENVRSLQEMGVVKKNVGLSPIRMLICMVYVMGCVVSVEGAPFPAANLQNCNSSEGCCTPVLSNSTRYFEFPGASLPLRVRPAAHKLDDAYIGKYQRATDLMRGLPDTDPRSFLNQYKLHCMYCDNNLYFDNSTAYPLEIHRSWLFLPWHRWFLYFYERILATLIEDDTFALPFWNWDNQELPEAAVVPRVWALNRSLGEQDINKTLSSLYDPDRTSCAHNLAGFLEFQNTSACPPFDRNATEVRATNTHLMYMNVVGLGSTPRMFLGAAYRYGDTGGGGEGSIEGIPHGAIHGWVNEHDMEGFKDSASDPIFFGHHANLDRLWDLWKTLPGGHRGDPPDSDYLDTEFTFYDEHGGLVIVSIDQGRHLDPLSSVWACGHTYKNVPNPWLSEPSTEIRICNPKKSQRDREALINSTGPFEGPLNFTKDSTFTFKLARNKSAAGEEILELVGNVTWSEFVKGDVLSVTAFAFHPEAPVDENMGCAEYLGVRWLFTHTGISPEYPNHDVWRFGIGHQLQLMGTDHLDHLVVTLVGSADSVHGIQLTSARIIYSFD